jgi:hypothetical protein
VNAGPFKSEIPHHPNFPSSTFILPDDPACTFSHLLSAIINSTNTLSLLTGGKSFDFKAFIFPQWQRHMSSIGGLARRPRSGNDAFHSETTEITTNKFQQQVFATYGPYW